jgi:hypothetical protein
VRWLGAIVLFSLACGAGPEAEDAQAYVDAMRQPLADNAVLAQRFLTDASEVKKQTMDGPKLAEQLARELAPQASTLSKTVAGLSPAEPELHDAHAILVQAWADRAAAYAAMNESWSKGDLAGWDAAMKQNTQSKLREEEYFVQVNAYLSAFDLRLEQYPE